MLSLALYLYLVLCSRTFTQTHVQLHLDPAADKNEGNEAGREDQEEEDFFAQCNNNNANAHLENNNVSNVASSVKVKPTKSHAFLATFEVNVEVDFQVTIICERSQFLILAIFACSWTPSLLLDLLFQLVSPASIYSIRSSLLHRFPHPLACARYSRRREQ